jgi:hypothetical protein
MSDEEHHAPEVEIHYKVFGEFDPELFSRVTSLTPTKTRRRGDPATTPRGGPAREDSWRLVLGPVATMDGTAQLIAMLELLEPAAEIMQQAQREQDLTMQLTFVAYVRDHRASAVPNVALDHEMLTRLASLGVDLDFDIMLLAPDDGNHVAV